MVHSWISELKHYNWRKRGLVLSINNNFTSSGTVPKECAMNKIYNVGSVRGSPVIWQNLFFMSQHLTFQSQHLLLSIPFCPCMRFLAGWLSQQIIDFPFCWLRQNVRDVLIKEIWEPLLSTQHCWLFIMLLCWCANIFFSRFI